jgi:hypothetical protein
MKRGASSLNSGEDVLMILGRYFIMASSRLRRFLPCTAVVFVALAAARGQQLRFSNPLPVLRADEVVEIPIAQVLAHAHIKQDQLAALVAVDPSGVRVPSQLYSSQSGGPPSLLLLLVQIPASGTADVTLRLDSKAAPQQSLVFGRPVPERKDDFAWENQQVAYRIYGPALEATGEISSGIDVWSKRIPNLVVNDFYKRDASRNPALSYHKDTGQGLDSYDVGPSRGCGGTAVWTGTALDTSKNYTAAHVIAEGPIRFEFELSYAPWKSGNITVTETKRITLDAGTHMNKIVSTYTFAGGSPLQLAAGLAVHKGADITVEKESSIASVWDTPQDPAAGRIATGMVALPSEHAQTLSAVNHVLLIFKRNSGQPFTYYAGAGWSKGGMPTQQDWNAYLDRFLTLREHPMTFSWRGR